MALITILIPEKTPKVIVDKVTRFLFIAFNYEMEYRGYLYEITTYAANDPALQLGVSADQCFVRFEEQAPTQNAKWLRLARMVQNILIPGSYTIDQLRIPQGQLN